VILLSVIELLPLSAAMTASPLATRGCAHLQAADALGDPVLLALQPLHNQPHLGFGRLVASEIEVPNMFANLMRSG
jgi:hypothetical protein